jgi:hypothetical protein
MAALIVPLVPFGLAAHQLRKRRVVGAPPAASSRLDGAG